MEQFFILMLVAATSVGAGLIGRGMGLSARRLRPAIDGLLQCLGTSLIFLAANLVIGMAVVLVARLLTRGFVSLYLVDDETLVVFSLLQGITFRWWREVGVE